MGYLYKIEFDNGKSYIGITSKDVPGRVCAHEHQARYGAANTVLYKAMRKYPGAYRAIPLLRADDWTYLQLMEKRAIAAYGTKVPNGYNLTDGGDGQLGVVWSKASRAKAAESKRGKPLSAEHRAKVSAALKGRPSPTKGMKFPHAGPSPLKGRPISAEHRAKIAASHVGIGHSAETRKKLSDINKGKRQAPWTEAQYRAMADTWMLKKLAGALL